MIKYTYPEKAVNKAKAHQTDLPVAVELFLILILYRYSILLFYVWTIF